MLNKTTLQNIIVELTVDEGAKLKEGLEKCFRLPNLFTAVELEGLERMYDLLMGLK